MIKKIRNNAYIDLLKENQSYRRLFVARTTSLLGDWFNTIAVFVLLETVYNQSALAFGTVLVLKFLPNTLLAAFAGSIADTRRKTSVMMFADISRCLVCLGYLAAALSPSPWIIYILLALQTALGAFFEPAKNAFLPTIVDKDKLLTANVLNSATWSMMLTLGAALGGIATEYWGWDVVICIDAVTYLISAWFVSLIRSSENCDAKQKAIETEQTRVSHIVEGLRYLKSNKDLLFMACIKGLYCIGGAIVLLHTVFGESVFRMGSSLALGVGTFYTVRGLGTGLGPIFSRMLCGQSDKALRIAISIGFFVASGFYFAFSYSNTLWLSLLLAFFAHMGSSTLWVFSTVMLQKNIAEEYRGRVFGFELALFTLTMSASTMTYSWLLQIEFLTPHEAARAHAIYWIIPGTLWLIWSISRLSKKRQLL